MADGDRWRDGSGGLGAGDLRIKRELPVKSANALVRHRGFVDCGQRGAGLPPFGPYGDNPAEDYLPQVKAGIKRRRRASASASTARNRSRAAPSEC